MTRFAHDPPEGPQPTCLNEGSDCRGRVEFHLNPDRDDFKAFPRCEYHQAKRLEQADKNREYMSDTPPAWFDPSYAGERWDEE
jgi:hypothetical protein